MTEKKRRVGGDVVGTDRLSKLTTELLYLTSTLLENKDVPSFARLSKTLQHGWIRPNLAITYHGETESGLLSAVAALGDRIDRVRELELTFYSVSGEDARNHGDAIGRFTGLRVLTLNGGTRCRDIAVHALLSRRLVNLKCLKCSASDPEGLIPRAIRETSDAHALLAAVDLTCDPRHLAAEPSEWLGRLRLLRVYDEGTSGHHHVYTELLRKCSVLEQLRVFGYHIRAAQFTDEWAVATFTGSTSKAIEHLDLAANAIGLSPVGLLAIARRCPSMKSITLSTISENKDTHRWDDMIPSFRLWSATLTSFQYRRFALEDVTATFLEQTRDLCPQLETLDMGPRGFSFLARPAHKLPDAVKASGLVAAWRKAHPLVKADPFQESEASQSFLFGQ